MCCRTSVFRTRRFSARVARAGLRVTLWLGLRFRAGLRFGVGFGRFLVGVASVVGLIKARTFENDSGPRSDLSVRLELAALGALLRRLGRHRLKLIPGVLAGSALVIIRWHYTLSMCFDLLRVALGRRRDDHGGRTDHPVVDRVTPFAFSEHRHRGLAGSGLLR